MVYTYIPYSKKVWWEESFGQFGNERRFAKLKSAKSFHPVQIYLAIDKFATKLSYQNRIAVNLPNFLPPNFPAIR